MAALDLPHYVHNCKHCEGQGATACEQCYGMKKVQKRIFSSVVCDKCGGKGSARCIACSGRARFNVYVLPALLGDELDGLDDARRHAEVSRRLNLAVNHSVDSYDAEEIAELDKNHNIIKLLDGSSVRFQFGGSLAGAFKESHEKNIMHHNTGVYNMLDIALHRLRFVGRLLSVAAKELPGRYEYVLQCYRLNIVKKEGVAK